MAVGDEDAAALASLSALKELRVSHTGLTDVGLGALTALSGLTSISLGGLNVRDSALAEVFRCLNQLRQVDLERCGRAGDGMLQVLAAAAPMMESLCLSYTLVTDDGMEGAIPHMPHLRRLELESCAIGDDSVKRIASGCSKLECLDLSDTEVGSAGVAALGRLRCLEQINLSFTDVGDWGLEQLARCTTLKRVNLDSRHVGDVGVAHISSLPNLEVLDLFGAAVTDVGCGSIARATSLKSLEVCSGAVTDAGVRHLRTLTGLRHLSLSQNWKVGNSSIPTILNLSGLTALNLSQSRVTSSAVVSLGCLPDLLVLSLAGTRVRRAAVEKLQSMKSDLEIRGVPTAERGLF
jgi:Leucine-rich repeat (LRR) protein